MHDILIAALFTSLLVSPCILAMRATRDFE